MIGTLPLIRLSPCGLTFLSSSENISGNSTGRKDGT